MADDNKTMRNKYKNISLGFFILFFVSMCVFIYSLRNNYSKMVSLRNAVYVADQNNGDVKGALIDLRNFVTTHINTNLTSGGNSVYPPIQLEYTYQRLVQSQLGSQTSNTQLYTDAENYCQTQVPNGFSGRYRIPCVENYINTHSLRKINVDPSLYEFAFSTPTFSLDLAGFSEVLTIILGALSLFYLISFLAKR